jgi:hypothetical protein
LPWRFVDIDSLDDRQTGEIDQCSDVLIVGWLRTGSVLVGVQSGAVRWEPGLIRRREGVGLFGEEVASIVSFFLAI